MHRRPRNGLHPLRGMAIAIAAEQSIVDVKSVL